MPSTTLIQTPAALQTVCADFQDQEWLALDTEFMRERTYYSQLCLVQLATPTHLACVDPLALDNIDPLLDLLYAPHPLKVLHSARQDLEVFFDLRGQPPGPVFDTQIAAAFLGYEEQIGYAPLVEAITGVKLDKAHTRANWALRPLSPAQLHYAEDDVRYLREVYLYLKDKLIERGRYEWAAEDFARLSDPALYRNDPDTAWQRIKQGHQLPPSAQPRLRALSAWREHTAQTRNLPRSWVLNDAALIQIARVAPSNSAALLELREVDEKSIKRWGDELIEVLAQTHDLPPATLWDSPSGLTPEQNQMYKQLISLLDDKANELDLNVSLLAPRRDLQRLVRGNNRVALLQGWRYEIIGRHFLSLLGRPEDAPAPQENR